MSIRTLLYLAWLQAVGATLGSLYASEILHLAPCVLCWYQRIAMYPLVLLIPLGIVKKDRHLPFLLLPLSLIGAVIALYHVLLQQGIIAESLAPCQAGISCVTKSFALFGFLTIPLFSLIAFVGITLCLFLAYRKGSYDN